MKVFIKVDGYFNRINVELYTSNLVAQAKTKDLLGITSSKVGLYRCG